MIIAIKIYNKYVIVSIYIKIFVLRLLNSNDYLVLFTFDLYRDKSVDITK